MTYHQTLMIAIHAAQAAGSVLREAFHNPGSHPGVDLDSVAEALIRQSLTAAFPDWGYRGEETGARSATPTGGPVHYWLVDPNDGTSAFLKGHRGSSVSIALLRDGVPVLGVVYAFAAPDDEGDLFAWAEDCGPLTRNGRPVNRQPWTTYISPQTVVYVSHDGDKRSMANHVCVSPGRFITVPGIAYRLALVAAGEGEVGVSLSSPCGWDYAAGHALLLATGGRLVNEKAWPVTYTTDGVSHTEYCFGGSLALTHQLARRRWNKTKVKERVPSTRFDLVQLEPGHAAEDAGRLRRAQGALLGQLAGDALGSLVEFRTTESIKGEYPFGPAC